MVDFNIPIRTLTCKNNQLEFSTGGGIVVDSDIEKEYEECMIKAAGIFEAINAVGWFFSMHDFADSVGAGRDRPAGGSRPSPTMKNRLNEKNITFNSF